jgi:hypothetical protein
MRFIQFLIDRCISNGIDNQCLCKLDYERTNLKRVMIFTIRNERIRLFLFFLIAPAVICRAEEAASGRWEGTVQIPDTKLMLVVDLAQDGRGGWVGSITIPKLSVKGAALTDIEVKDSVASFAMKTGRSLEATFRARLTDKTLSGDFTQAGNTAPFVLKKTGPPQVEVPPHSTMIAKELEGEWKGEYGKLGSTRQVTVKLRNRAADGATAEFVIVGKKTNNLPIDLVTQEGDWLTIDSHEIGISYEGRLKRDSGEITGTLEQGPIEIPLVLHRAK